MLLQKKKQLTTTKNIQKINLIKVYISTSITPTLNPSLVWFLDAHFK